MKTIHYCNESVARMKNMFKEGTVEVIHRILDREAVVIGELPSGDWAAAHVYRENHEFEVYNTKEGALVGAHEIIAWHGYFSIEADLTRSDLIQETVEKLYSGCGSQALYIGALKHGGWTVLWEDWDSGYISSLGKHKYKRHAHLIALSIIRKLSFLDETGVGF